MAGVFVGLLACHISLHVGSENLVVHIDNYWLMIVLILIICLFWNILIL